MSGHKFKKRKVPAKEEDKFDEYHDVKLVYLLPLLDGLVYNFRLSMNIFSVLRYLLLFLNWRIEAIKSVMSMNLAGAEQCPRQVQLDKRKTACLEARAYLESEIEEVKMKASKMARAFLMDREAVGNEDVCLICEKRYDSSHVATETFCIKDNPELLENMALLLAWCTCYYMDSDISNPLLTPPRRGGAIDLFNFVEFISRMGLNFESLTPRSLTPSWLACFLFRRIEPESLLHTRPFSMGWSLEHIPEVLESALGHSDWLKEQGLVEDLDSFWSYGPLKNRNRILSVMQVFFTDALRVIVSLKWNRNLKVSGDDKKRFKFEKRWERCDNKEFFNDLVCRVHTTFKKWLPTVPESLVRTALAYVKLEMFDFES